MTGTHVFGVLLYVIMLEYRNKDNHRDTCVWYYGVCHHVRIQTHRQSQGYMCLVFVIMLEYRHRQSQGYMCLVFWCLSPC